MASYRQILSTLIASATGDLDDNMLAELAATAQTLAKLGVSQPPTGAPAPKAAPDPREAARARLAELNASPLPPGASETAKIRRAQEHEAALRVLHPELAGPSNAEAFDIFFPTGGDAA